MVPLVLLVLRLLVLDGDSTAAKSNYPLTVPKNNRSKYPLVTLPGNQQQRQTPPPVPTSAKPEPVPNSTPAGKPKKYIPSYDERTIEQERLRSREQHNTSPPQASSKPLPIKPFSSKPLPDPDPEPEPEPAPFKVKPQRRPPSPTTHTNTSAESNTNTNVDTSNMSVKERMALLSAKGDSSRPPIMGKKPDVSARPDTAGKPNKGDNMLAEMMRKQRERQANQSETQSHSSSSVKPTPSFSHRTKSEDKPLPSPPENRKPLKPVHQTSGTTHCLCCCITCYCSAWFFVCYVTVYN